MAFVTGFDLTIDTAIAIPGATPLSAAAGDADVRVTQLPSAPALASAPLYQLQDDTLTFCSSEALYHCRRDVIDVAPRPAADPDAVAGLLIATALPAVLWMRGAFVLHAAALVGPGGDGAVAIMGPSGAGKSTVAAQLIADGAMLLADDSLRLERGDAAILASGLSGGYHLADLPGAPRSFHALSPARTRRRAPLAAAMVLSRTDGAPGITRLEPIEALQHWLKGRHRERIPGLLGRHGEMLDFCGHLVKQVPLYSWRRAGPGLTQAERTALARTLGW